jgi:hypothetical protein
MAVKKAAKKPNEKSGRKVNREGNGRRMTVPA